MAKDPAFLFYPNDFIGGTMGMTLEEKGAYLELLILQFNKGAFTIEQAKRALGEKFQNLWPHIIDKFSEVSGSYHNPRLKEEIEKRKSYSASRRKNREKKDMNNICVTYDKDMIKTGDTNVKTYVPHMENENENIISNIIKEESKKVFNSMPTSDILLDLPTNHIKSAIEQVKILKNIMLNEEKVMGMFRAFKVQNLTGKKWYQDEAAIFSHFLNWLKQQNFKVDRYGVEPQTETISTADALRNQRAKQAKYDN